MRLLFVKLHLWSRDVKFIIIYEYDKRIEIHNLNVFSDYDYEILMLFRLTVLIKPLNRYIRIENIPFFFFVKFIQVC